MDLLALQSLREARCAGEVCPLSKAVRARSWKSGLQASAPQLFFLDGGPAGNSKSRKRASPKHTCPASLKTTGPHKADCFSCAGLLRDLRTPMDTPHKRVKGVLSPEHRIIVLNKILCRTVSVVVVVLGTNVLVLFTRLIWRLMSYNSKLSATAPPWLAGIGGGG